MIIKIINHRPDLAPPPHPPLPLAVPVGADSWLGSGLLICSHISKGYIFIGAIIYIIS